MENTNANLSARATKALAIIAAGGRFRNKLERAYRGGEKFRVRLINVDGHAVRGFGHSALRELQRANLLRRVSLWKSSTWPEEYVAADAPVTEAELEVEAAHKAEWAY